MSKALVLSLSPDAIASLTIGVLGFATLLALSFLALRWIAKRGFSGFSSEHMQLIDRLITGRDSAILLLRIGSRYMALGQGRDGLRFLCELSPEDFPGKKPEKHRKKGGFFGRFFHNMKVNAHLLPKGTPYRRPGGDEEDNSGVPAEPPFAEMLRQATARRESENPMPGGKAAPQSGYPRVYPPAGSRREKTENDPRPPESAAPLSRDPEARPRAGEGDAEGGYQDSLALLHALSEHFERSEKSSARSPAPGSGAMPYIPPPGRRDATPPRSGGEGSREEKIDELLNRIAERQSRYNRE